MGKQTCSGLLALTALLLVCLTAQAASATGSSESTTGIQPSVVFALGLIALALLAGGIFAYGAWRNQQKAAAELKKTLSALESKIQPCAVKVRQLEREDYFSYLKQPRHWLSLFTGKTRERYRLLTTAYRELKARIDGLRTRLSEARLLAGKRCRLPWATNVGKALDLLQLKQLEVTEELLPDQEPRLISGYPSAWADEIELLTGRVERLLQEQEADYSTCESNEASLAELMAEIISIRSTFTAEGFAFEPYEEDLAAVQQERLQFLQQKQHDPYGAAQMSGQLLDTALSLKQEMQERLDAKAELQTDIETGICRAEDKVADVRKQPAVDLFPAIQPEGDTTADTSLAPDGSGSVALLQLTEEGFNPDVPLARARSQKQEALRLILSVSRNEPLASGRQLARANRGARAPSLPEETYGSLRQSMQNPAPASARTPSRKELYHTAVEAARSLTAEAVEMVENTLKAKASIESIAGGIEVLFGSLAEALADESETRHTLKQEFLALNFSEEEATFVAAEELLGKAEYLAIRDEYRAQNYNRALERIEALVTRIEDAIARLPRATNRLKQLQRQRQRARDGVASCKGQLPAVRGKLERHDFTSAAETKSQFALVCQQLAELEAAVAQAVCDWPSADLSAGQIAATLQTVSNDIDEQKVAHDAAVDKVESLEPLINEARRATAPKSTRRLGRTKMADAEARFLSLKQALATPGSNWSDLAKQAEETKPIAREAAKRGNYDREAYEKATEVLDAAKEKQRRLGRHATGPVVSEKMQTANANLEEAMHKWDERAWEDAAKLAALADTSYRGALNARGM